MTTSAQTLLLRLRYTPGLGPRKIRTLVDSFATFEALEDVDTEALAAVDGIGQKLAQSIIRAKADALSKAEAELARAQRLKVTLYAYGSATYPKALTQIYDPPPVLYVKGTLPAGLNAPVEKLPSLGIVGTRNASSYGLGVAKTFARELAEEGISIISGMALGIDAAAHQGALAATGGNTVAVLGSSVDNLYPLQNSRLAEEILHKGGAIVSEYPLGTKPRPENFPGRNRIINGLSKGILVVEGAERSGALITADYALNEGREVFAVPGRLGDPRAAGPLALLAQGATLAQSAQSIRDTLGWQRSQAHRSAPLPEGFAGELVTLIRQSGEPALDELLDKTGKKTPELMSVLMQLELYGLVQSLPNGRYRSEP